MQEWEYKVISDKGLSEEELEKKMNELGEQGWEFVWPIFNLANAHSTPNRLVFKRPLSTQWPAPKPEEKQYGGGFW